MDEKKKKLLKNILLYGGLILVIAFNVITSIVVNYKRKKLDELKYKNQQMEDVIGDENLTLKFQKDENFSKNLLNFIDNK